MELSLVLVGPVGLVVGEERGCMKSSMAINHVILSWYLYLSEIGFTPLAICYIA